MTADDERREPVRRRGQQRWWVHLALLVTATVSLVLEPMLSLHILLGLVFVGFVVIHLGQRRRVSAALVRRLPRVAGWTEPGGRLAVADGLLTVLTAAMLASGLYDWLGHQPTRIRWHALTGVALAAFLLVHTVRRRSRLRDSAVR